MLAGVGEFFKQASLRHWHSALHRAPPLHAVQTLLTHKALVQSPGPAQVLPFWQRPQLPPQSISVSVPSLMPLVHDGAGVVVVVGAPVVVESAQRPPVQVPLM